MIRRRPTLIAAGLLLIVSVAAASWLVGARVQSSDQAAARAAPPTPSLVTAPVELRVLQSAVIARGNVSPVVSTGVTGPRSADGAADVVTAIFAANGSEVDLGTRLFDLSGRPVFVFAGTTPAYRTMRPGASGVDIRQLQAGLVAVGCAAGDSGVYDAATKLCVGQLYADSGYETVASSPTEAMDLAAAQTTLTSAQDDLAAAQVTLFKAAKPASDIDVERAQLAVDDATRQRDDAKARLTAASKPAADVDAALAALNSLLASGQASNEDIASTNARLVAAITASDAAKQTSQADLDAAESAVKQAQLSLDDLTSPPDVSVEQLAVDQAQARVDAAQQDVTRLQDTAGPVVPLGEVVFAPALPARFDMIDPTIGSDAQTAADTGSGGALATLTSGGWQIDAQLPAAARSTISVGMSADIVEETSAVTLTGSVASIGERPTPSAAAGAGPTYPVTVSGPIPDDWAGQNVRVTFTAAATPTPVLVVPLAAVTSTTGGQPQIRVVRDDIVTIVEVQPGLSADGFVEIQPQPAGTVTEGDQVVVG